MPFRNIVLAIAGAAVLAAVGAWLLRRPSNARTWSGDQSRLPRVRFDGHRVHVADVRNFAYRSEYDFDERWDDRTYDLDQLASVWFVLVPLSERFQAPAHAFVSFGFDDGSYVSISIEARREAGERYSALLGLFRKYELIYVMGDERDVIGRRALYDGSPVYLYPIKATREAVRAIFVEMLTHADALHAHPAFYNTLTDNCTNLLIRHVKQAVPDRIRAGIAAVLPGYADEVAVRLGLIEGVTTVAEARRRYRINDKARAAEHAPDFSARIRATD
jgi:hypothetical protein